MCKHQFALGHGYELRFANYSKGTYLHYTYKHYTLYKCNNKKYNHIIVKHHTTNINDTYSELITGSISMKGIRFPLHVILTALTLYFLNNS